MHKFYVAGPNSGWGGVCEVDDQERRYIHHRYWPVRSNGWTEFYSNDPLKKLIREGHWKLKHPAKLVLPIGV